jgi:hypothetical protein
LAADSIPGDPFERMPSGVPAIGERGLDFREVAWGER